MQIPSKPKVNSERTQIFKTYTQGIPRVNPKSLVKVYSGVSLGLIGTVYISYQNKRHLGNIAYLNNASFGQSIHTNICPAAQEEQSPSTVTILKNKLHILPFWFVENCIAYVQSEYI